jgi:microcystin degradation protein MlrC
MTRVLVAGFLHETNTFARTPARWENFENGEGFPRMHTGQALLDLAAVNIPAGGFITEADDAWDLLPVIWCAASPSGPVEKETYERVSELITQACEQERPDAVYLDLHGAMVAEHQSDGDGEIIRRVRAVVGPDVPIVVSLDLHANISDLMLETADAQVAYRTYPHVDMAETGVRAAQLLRRLLAGETFTHAEQSLDFLIPTISGCTLDGPAQELYSLLESIEDEDGVLTFAMAFPATDVPDCRPRVFGYGQDAAALAEKVRHIAERAAQLEPAFTMEALPADRAITAAAEAVAEGTRPVVVADTQDNPGAGGDARTTGLLEQLLAADEPGSALAALWYPDVVEAAVAAGVGSEIDVTFSGSGTEGEESLSGRFEVVRITDGEVHFDGPMMHGNDLSVGPSVLLRSGNTHVIVNARKAQIMDRNQFRAAGIVPEEQSILIVKSSVHFRGDYDGIAGQILVGLAPGPFPADPAHLPWQNLSDGVRLGPLGPVFQRPASGDRG